MKIVHVTALNKVDAYSYTEGDLFITEKSIGILHNGEIDQLMKKSDLKGYIKKTEVEKMIAESVKQVTAND